MYNSCQRLRNVYSDITLRLVGSDRLKIVELDSTIFYPNRQYVAMAEQNLINHFVNYISNRYHVIEKFIAAPQQLKLGISLSILILLHALRDTKLDWLRSD